MPHRGLPSLTPVRPTATRPEPTSAAPVSRTSVGFAAVAPLPAHADSREPLVDTEVPCIVRSAAARSISNISSTIVPLPPLPPISSDAFDFLLIKKLEVCSLIMDFTDGDTQVDQKSVKLAILTELVTLFETPEYHIESLKPRNQFLLFQMLEKNIFLQDPSFVSLPLGDDYNVAIVESSWPHLQLCFQILNRFAELFPTSEVWTLAVAKAAIHLTQLPDLRERNQLVVFLRIYADSHQGERVLIATEIARLLTDVLEGGALPFCAAPLITLFTQTISRMQGAMPPPYSQLFLDSILPLLSCRHLPLFFYNITQLLFLVMPVNHQIVIPTLKAFERYWPHTNGQKQALLIDLLSSICAKLPQPILDVFVTRLFRIFAACLMSHNAKLVDAVLESWTANKSGDWIWNNARKGILEMHDNVVTVSEKFWHLGTREKAARAISEMSKIDKTTFHKLRVQQKQVRAQRRQRKYVSNDVQRHWAEIVDAAMEAYGDVNVKEKKRRIYDLFHNEGPETLAPTRFITMFEKEGAEPEHD
jgi:serine/threonine-protein phosphatase 2A regulatory subunit B'